MPFLSILLTSPEVSTKLGKRHQTVAQRTGQVVGWVRRMLPGRPIQLVGDGAYSVILLGLRCQQQGVSLLAPLRLDARLFDHPSLVSGKRLQGRPAIVGQRLPRLIQVAQQPTTRWQRGWIRWYDGMDKRLDWATGTTPLFIRWVLVRDPLGDLPLRAYFATDIHQPAYTMIAVFVNRWSLEVTFEESRQHLCIETQRQWNDKAIERTGCPLGPTLFGLFSLVTLFVHALYPNGSLPLPTCAWYPKTDASFHDLLALVRRALWNQFTFQTSPLSPTLCLIPRADLARLAAAVCY